jgi:hypothetical protein
VKKSAITVDRDDPRSPSSVIAQIAFFEFAHTALNFGQQGYKCVTFIAWLLNES